VITTSTLSSSKCYNKDNNKDKGDPKYSTKTKSVPKQLSKQQNSFLSRKKTHNITSSIKTITKEYEANI